jgi:hypothetical protein
MKGNQLAKFFLRFGLAFVFVYAAVEIYFHPANFLKYVPDFILDQVPLDLFLLSFGIIEIALAVWLLSGWKGVYPAVMSLLMIAGIVIFNMEHFQILFRNIAIGFAALALAMLEITKDKSAREKFIEKMKSHLTSRFSIKSIKKTFLKT